MVATMSPLSALAAPDRLFSAQRNLRTVGSHLATLSHRLGAAERKLSEAHACVVDAGERIGRAKRLISLMERRILGWTPTPEANPPANTGSSEPRNGRSAERTGPPAETRLLVAILSEAIESLWKNSPRSNRRQRRLYGEELNWLGVQDDESPFSFLYICSVLGLDPDYVRRGVLARDRSIATDVSARTVGN